MAKLSEDSYSSKTSYGEYLRKKAQEEKERRLEEAFNKSVKAVDDSLKGKGTKSTIPVKKPADKQKTIEDLNKTIWKSVLGKPKSLWELERKLQEYKGKKSDDNQAGSKGQNGSSTVAEEQAKRQKAIEEAGKVLRHVNLAANEQAKRDKDIQSGQQNVDMPALKIRGDLIGKTPKQLDQMHKENSFDPYKGAVNNPEPSPMPQADREEFDKYNTDGKKKQEAGDVENAIKASSNRKTPDMLSEPAEKIARDSLAKIKADPAFEAEIKKQLSDLGCDTSDNTLYQLVVDATFNKDFADASGISKQPFYKKIQKINQDTTTRYITPAAEEIAGELKNNTTIDYGGVLKKAGEQGYSADDAGVTQLIRDKINDPKNLEAFCSYTALDDTYKGWVNSVLRQQDFKKGENELAPDSFVKIGLTADIVNTYANSGVAISHETAKDIAGAVMDIAKSKYLAEQSVEKALGIDSIRGRQAYGWGERLGGSILYNMAEAGMGLTDFGLEGYSQGKNMISKPTQAFDAILGTNSSNLRDPMDKKEKELKEFWDDQEDLTERYLMARGGDAEAMGITGGLLRGATKALMDAAMLYAAGGGKSAATGLKTAEAADMGAKAGVNLDDLYNKGVKYINGIDQSAKTGLDIVGSVKKIMGEDTINYITEKVSGRLMEKAGIPFIESEIQRALAKQGLEMTKDKVSYYARTLYDRITRGEQSDYDRYKKERMEKGATGEEAKNQADYEFYLKRPFGLD
jgi:hypothetical protein